MRKEHILVIRFSALGDVAMAVPVVWALANQYPDIRVTVLANQYPDIRVTVLSRGPARPLFDDLAPNVNFMEADVKHEYHGVRGLNALYRRLAAKQFTKVADLHNVLRSDYLRMRFNLGRYRVEHIDKHRRMRRKLTSYKHKVMQQLPSSFENYAEVFARLGGRRVVSRNGSVSRRLPHTRERSILPNSWSRLLHNSSRRNPVPVSYSSGRESWKNSTLSNGVINTSNVYTLANTARPYIRN